MQHRSTYTIEQVDKASENLKFVLQKISKFTILELKSRIVSQSSNKILKDLR